MPIQTIDAATYERERAICTAADEYAESIMCEGGTKRRRNYITKEEAAAPVYAACNNEMRGRVEQFEILRDLPDVIIAYIGEAKGNGIGLDRVVGQTYPVTVWTGLPIGYATRGDGWRIYNSAYGSHMYQFYAKIGGREYTGRGFGSGMCIRLKETAASKRARAMIEAA